jgi:periplasmic protein TonB
LLRAFVVKYTPSVARLNSPLVRFFAISLAIHMLALLWWPKPSRWRIDQEPIAVALLSQSENTESQQQASASKRSAVPKKTSGRPRESPPRPPNASNQVAKNNPAPMPETPLVPREVPPPQEPKREEPQPRSRERIPDKATVVERSLPTLKDLLPPVGWSDDRRGEAPIHLDTKNPQYVTYFNTIKRAIETVWQYPELALKYGLQGKLLLEFSVLGNGDLEAAKIVRSSGSNLLDDEALRAVRAAAPFGPIPPWIGRNRIEIVASFEYLDNRLNYRFMP